MARPRSVPEEEVLERALSVFWEHGYDRTTISDLSDAIGLGASSIYNAYTSKLGLYQRSIKYYMQTHALRVNELLTDESDRPIDETIYNLLGFLTTLYTSKCTPLGCAMFQSAGAGGPESCEACAFTVTIKQDLERGLTSLFRSRERAGDSLSDSPQTLARFTLATLRGISQLATDGIKRSDLLRVARRAAESCVLN